jgi:hypothetical protein
MDYSVGGKLSLFTTADTEKGSILSEVRRARPGLSGLFPSSYRRSEVRGDGASESIFGGELSVITRRFSF